MRFVHVIHNLCSHIGNSYISTIMAFVVNQEFNSFEELLQVKKAYECANNVVLVRRDTHLLKGEGELVRKLIYSRLSLQCKAGRERPSESKGVRKSSTFKKNCPMRVSFMNLYNLRTKTRPTNRLHDCIDKILIHSHRSTSFSKEIN